MKKWVQKAIVQKTISYLPFSNRINYFFQKYVTKGVNLSDAYFYDRLGHARDHLMAYKKYSGEAFPETSLEIGTGWYPIVPIAFFLTGVKRIYSVDISFLTSKERMLTTLNAFRECERNGKLETFLCVNSERWKSFNEVYMAYETLSLKQVLQKFNIVYLIEDARKLSLNDNSVDLVNSNNTFEHIYPEILIPILKEFKRVVKKPDGVMSHFIDMSDHFAHFDNSITIYNFLRYSDKQWSRIDNSIQPQNRCRIYEYKKIYSDLGIPITEELNRLGQPRELRTIPLAEKYRNRPLPELAISHCHFISAMETQS